MFNNLSYRTTLLLLFLLTGSFSLYAQSRDDSQAARQYVQWIQQAINEGRINDALAAIRRASDFADVSSDVSYLAAYILSGFGERNTPRHIIIDHLNRAVEINRWVNYNKNQALLMLAEQYTAIHNFTRALAVLDLTGEAAGTAQTRADAAMLRLLALRGMAAGNVNALAQFRSQVLAAMDLFPRDPRPLRIFLEYARNRQLPSEMQETIADNGQLQAIGQVSSVSSDIHLLELVLRRLPLLLETDPDLAWMAAPFIRDVEDARRLTASYRAGGISNVQNRGFIPHPGSIPAALNLGLIDDRQATEELFSERRGQDNPVLDKEIITNVYNLLRSEEGRELFSRRLHSFTGVITVDADNDGFIDSRAIYNSGTLGEFILDRNQDNIIDLRIVFDTGGVPVSAGYFILEPNLSKDILWERYPSVRQVISNGETFKFGPADFQYAPVSFIELGGSNNITGLLFPVPSDQYMELNRHALLSFSSSVTRPSAEIQNAAETIFLNRGTPQQAVEELNGRRVSVTEFENGLPVLQYIDLDLDGRMETIRRFRSPAGGSVRDVLDYRSLIASSESDWSGDGRHKTMEVYLPDGSVVYYFDMEGSGEMNYTEAENR